MRTQPLVILLAEDDDGHALLVQKNLSRAGLTNEIVRVKDGQAALNFLFREGEFSARPAGPLLVVMDINMPLVDGVEALARIKADERTAKFPVIMLTTTDDPQEVNRCYKLGCSVYITKPVEYEPFVEAVRRLGLFLQIVQVPHQDSPTG